MFHYHDGERDFPHGAGASEPGWYVYPYGDTTDEPCGPYPSEEAARVEASEQGWFPEAQR